MSNSQRMPGPWAVHKGLDYCQLYSEAKDCGDITPELPLACYNDLCAAANAINTIDKLEAKGFRQQKFLQQANSKAGLKAINAAISRAGAI